MQRQFSQNPNYLYTDPEANDPNEENAQEAHDPLDICIICVQPKNGMFCFVPCGHSLACRTCSETIMANANRTNGPPKCPSCRTVLTGFHQVFVQNF